MHRRDFIASFCIANGILANKAFGQNDNFEKIAKTKTGNYIGKKNSGIICFKGIKYGVASRFSLPQFYENKNEIMTAFDFGASCPQSNKNEILQSEDCLFLNIFTPSLDNKKRPVMFYIHGGAYMNGSASDDLYDGSKLCQDGDVVVVTINHRLNAFGYLYLAQLEREIKGKSIEFSATGNLGQLDIILALKWVKSHIQNFGGDPNKIMAFGQSGGGAKIATLMAMPKAEGLFNCAATMSGQQVTASGPNNAHKRTLALFEALGLKKDIISLEKLKSIPAQEIVAALKTIDPIIQSGGLYMGPVLDEFLLFNHPFYPKANGWGTKIPMMIGNTKDETRAFFGNDEKFQNLGWEDLPKILPQHYRVDIDVNLVIESYRKIYPNYTATEVFFAATTAGRSWRGAIIEAEERAKIGANAFVYQFNWQSLKDGGKWRAPHTIDIPMVFQTTGAKNSLSDDGIKARKMAKIVSASFIAFAKTGNPQTEFIPKWPKYSLKNRETMLFDLPPILINDPRRLERKLFEKVPFIQQGT